MNDGSSVRGNPSVMLSPNATNRVTEILGGGGGAATVIENEHVVFCRLESAALHVTVVVPIVNAPPLGGRQSVLVGAVPPVVVAGG